MLTVLDLMASEKAILCHPSLRIRPGLKDVRLTRLAATSPEVRLRVEWVYPDNSVICKEWSCPMWYSLDDAVKSLDTWLTEAFPE